MSKICLDRIISLGRSLNDYIDMFSLKKCDLNKKILDCGGGPSSFNCEMNINGHNAITIDPIYKHSEQFIEERVIDSFNDMMDKAKSNKQKFNWDKINSIEELREIKLSIIDKFLADYRYGKREGRYIDAGLPILPFGNKQFDIALCSHLLFLYSNKLSYDFHKEAIIEMLRVANEVRIFPLIDLNSNISPYLDNIINLLIKKRKKVVIEAVNYEFQKGAYRQLIITN